LYKNLFAPYDDGVGAKTDASGAAMPVWQDYVAGTDPTNTFSVAGTAPTNTFSKFTAKIEMKDGEPVVTWSHSLARCGGIMI
jgi:hypothetical protein